MRGCLGPVDGAKRGAQQQSFAVEFRLSRHGGAWRSILENGSPYHSESGEFVGYIGSCIDVTEVRRSHDAAEESDARYRTLAESLPHLVWTCMPDGWCDYLSRQWVEYTGVPEERHIITRAIGARQDLRSILQVVLSNIEDHLPVPFGCVCLGNEDTSALWVAAVGAKSAALASATGLEEKTKVTIDSNGLSRSLGGQLVHEPDTRQVWGLASELREALINLIFNAVDAMPDGGTLTVRTRNDSVEAGGNPFIEVVDTGVGMDDELRRRCFGPFMTTNGERGTGLGLALVYGVVQRHNASIEIDTRPGAGTTIVFAGASAAASHVQRLSEPAPPTLRLRLLVIDDDPRLLKSLGDALRSFHHEVRVEDSGATGILAFEAARRNGAPFDLVITNLGMPHVDGKKVAAAVKAASPTTPVVLLTGWGRRLAAEDSGMPNVDQILSKPPKLTELRDALRRLHAEAST